MNTKPFLIGIFTLVITTLSFGQYFEGGILIGASNYKGELQDNLEPEEYNLAFGIFSRYNHSRYLSFKAHFNYAKVSGTDANYDEEDALRARNLSFRSSILELGVTTELNLSRFDIRDGKIAAPYLFAGISGIHFNPQAEFEGRWIDLQPLGTEGQNMYEDMSQYKRISVAIPFGLGFKFSISNTTNIGMEFGFRKLFTDYLDDVSTDYPDINQLRTISPLAAELSFRSPEYSGHPMPNPSGEVRGNSSDKDWYFIAGLTVSVNLVSNKHQLEFDEKYRDFYQEEIEQGKKDFKATHQSDVKKKKKKRRAKKKSRKKKEQKEKK